MSRVTLHFELLPGLAESLVEPLRQVLGRLNGRLPRKLQEPSDPELAAIWAAELEERFRKDTERVLEVLEDSDFGLPGYSMEITRAEALLRGAAALRLALRETALPDISDAELERGDLHPVHVPEEQREGVLCFWFLGALQELLVQALDPESGSPEDAGEDHF